MHEIEGIALVASGQTVRADVELARGATVEGTVRVNGEPVSARVWWRMDNVGGAGRSNDSRCLAAV